MSLLALFLTGGAPQWLAAIGSVSLFFTPGAWIAFAAELDGLPFWARLLGSAMLSPLVMTAEFYALRLLGVPFDRSAAMLVWLNLPALYFVRKRLGNIAALTRGEWIAGIAVVAISAASMASIVDRMDARIFSPHGWYHADAIYMFARGALSAESPTLAGLRLSYPVWTALVAPAVQSYLMNSPPVVTYVWANLLALIAACAFAAGITKQLGGGRLAQSIAGLWLLLGTNPVGYVLMKLDPMKGTAHQIWGDPRYTPWVSKFMVSSPMALGLGIFMAVVYLLVRPRMTGGMFVTTGLLTATMGLFYPLLMPPLCALIGVRALVPVLVRRERPWPYREWLAWTGLLLIACVVTYAEIKFITASRMAGGSPVQLSALATAARKTIAALIATSLLIAGLAYAIRKCWKAAPAATFVLAGGALSSYVLYTFISIPFYENEYKFIFSAAMCLAAFPAIAVERTWLEWPRGRAAVLSAALGVLLIGHYVHYTYTTWPSPWIASATRGRLPDVNLSEFQVRLQPSELQAGICDAILRGTPPNTVLLLEDDAVYYPAFTNRSLYVAPSNSLYPGVNLHVDDIDADLRGYGRQIIDRRRATLSAIFGDGGDAVREQAFREVLALHRPVAVIADDRRVALRNWLERSGAATQLTTANGVSVWLAGGRAELSSAAR